MPQCAELLSESRLEFLNAEKLPVVIRPDGNESLEELLAGESESLAELLRQYGAILFRGFSVRTAEDFRAVTARLFENGLGSYTGGASPRRQLLPGVFESTRLPQSLRMAQHNEMSYLPHPPTTIVFFCEVEPQQGGETPLADSREIYRQMPADLLRRFQEHGVRYHRHMYGARRNPLFDALNRWLKVRRSWMETYSTTDRADVERISALQDGNAHWDKEDGVRITTELPALRRHPETGEPLWFNHVATFLVTPQSIGLARYLLYRLVYFNPLRRPAHATFGNGAPISLGQLRAINAAIDRATVRFRWQQGDLLLLDNLTMTHGRMPFRGKRSILVAMN